MKFLVIGDFHYKKHMYISQVSDLERILARAAEEQVDFVIHVGDFSNDYAGSSEIIDLFLNNPYGLPVYGIYGNHELETGNTMDFVTPRLCNRPVIFPEGQRIGYWYTDVGNFRLVGLDTNYSLSPVGRWERSYDGSHCPPRENTQWCSLGPAQLAWLDAVLEDACKAEQKVLIFSHCPLWEIAYPAPDWPEARRIIQKYPGTVLAAINGHVHTDHLAVIENTVYWDVNVARLGGWCHRNAYHYETEHTYAYQDYIAGQKSGNVQQLPINSMTQATNSWFFADPLSAVATVTEDGCFRVLGAKTQWLYGVEPDYEADGMKPRIEDREVHL